MEMSKERKSIKLFTHKLEKLGEREPNLEQSDWEVGGSENAGDNLERVYSLTKSSLR